MKKQQGLTLIELMISMALGLFIIAATLSVYINTIKSSSNTLKSARLNHDLGMAMSLMSNDIKRAGYWGGAQIGASNLLNNPFTAATTNLGIFNFTAPSTSAAADPGNCIVYSYDANRSGALTPTVLTDDVDTAEYYGFRLIVENGIGSIQIRTTGSTTANCTEGNWERITDENMINITSVQFSFAPLDTLTATSRCLNASIPITSIAPTNPTNALICNPAPTAGQEIAQKRMINIVLTGGLIGADNAEVTKTLSDTIKVGNNRVFTQP